MRYPFRREPIDTLRRAPFGFDLTRAQRLINIAPRASDWISPVRRVLYVIALSG